MCCCTTNTLTHVCSCESPPPPPPHAWDQVGDEVLDFNGTPAIDALDSFAVLARESSLRLGTGTAPELRMLDKLHSAVSKGDFIAGLGVDADVDAPEGPNRASGDPLRHVHDVIMMELPGDTEGDVLDDVVYQYSRAAWVGAAGTDSLLHRVRGALLTLSAQLNEVVTGDKPVEVTLEAGPMGSEVVHVLFRSLGPSLLLAAAVSHRIASGVALQQTFDTALVALNTLVGPLAAGAR
jgi:hypothetical protein